ncbi:MAG: N-acetyltransferase [Thermomicrobiales bacterium]
MIIRPESPADATAIHALTAAAFAGKPYSDGTEPYVIDALRADGALAISLVAEEQGEVVGHVAFSLVSIADEPGTWYGLGPVSVAPSRQRQGIGTALIETGLAQVRDLGAEGCVLLGDPAYYRRFGFSATRSALPGCRSQVRPVAEFYRRFPGRRGSVPPGFRCDRRPVASRGSRSQIARNPAAEPNRAGYQVSCRNHPAQRAALSFFSGHRSPVNPM